MREDNIAKMLNDPAVRTWVKVQYRQALDRDILDAIEDANQLHYMLSERWKIIKAEVLK